MILQLAPVSQTQLEHPLNIIFNNFLEFIPKTNLLNLNFIYLFIYP